MKSRIYNMRDIIVHECPYCGSLFSSLIDLDYHIDRNHNRSEYPCPFQDCNAWFRTESDLEDHINHRHNSCDPHFRKREDPHFQERENPRFRKRDDPHFRKREDPRFH